MNGKLLELKARVTSLDGMRKSVSALRAVYIGTYRQTDTYFNSPKGRLKLREENNSEGKAKLIYYMREDLAGPKKDEVILIDVQEPESFKTLLEQLLGQSVIVDKEREIYNYQGTQIHLDTVKKLGTFIEFERLITDYEKDHTALEELMARLNIKEKDLIQASYSDLLQQ